MNCCRIVKRVWGRTALGVVTAASVTRPTASLLQPFLCYCCLCCVTAARDLNMLLLLLLLFCRYSSLSHFHHPSPLSHHPGRPHTPPVTHQNDWLADLLTLSLVVVYPYLPLLGCSLVAACLISLPGCLPPLLLLLAVAALCLLRLWS